MNEHFKLPLLNIAGEFSGGEPTFIVNADGLGVSDVCTDLGTHAEDAEIAAHIVKCVNSHDALVTACKLAWRWHTFDPSMSPPEIVSSLHNALEQAGEL